MVAIKFGVLLVPFQPLDAIGPMDILLSCSQPYIQNYERMGSAVPGLSKHGIDLNVSVIGETLAPLQVENSFGMIPSTLCDCDLELDYLLVGGPLPTYEISPCFAELVKAHVAKGKVLFTTCTGSLVVAQTGILDGKVATTTHGFLEVAKTLYPKVNWRRDKEWEISGGNIWTASGAGGGMDMITYWVQEHYGLDIINFGLDALNFAPRDINGTLIVRKED